jgi:hypothetical protein
MDILPPHAWLYVDPNCYVIPFVIIALRGFALTPLSSEALA